MNSKDLSQLLRKQWQISPYGPIDIQRESLEHLNNLTIVWMPLNKEINGCCSKNDDDFLVILNSAKDIGNQNFTLAHEIYHLLFEKSKEWIICSDDDNSESERNANAFASHLLLPEISLYDYAKRNDIGKWDTKNMISCEQYFQVSHATLLERLKDSKLEFELDNDENIPLKAKALGYDTRLYLPSSKRYHSLGKYIRLTQKEYGNEKFSTGKRDELLKAVFRSDIIDEF